MPDGD
jgi:hypothetical protein